MLFHARSRPGRHDYPSGGVFAHPEVAQLPRSPAPARARKAPASTCPSPTGTRCSPATRPSPKSWRAAARCAPTPSGPSPSTNSANCSTGWPGSDG
ncbi:hypothetical protein ACFQ1I_34445 [Kitasatospora arboriphila]